ncbi:hypothetical protein ASE95_15910 [Sphingomonas sp. Leaf231]|nr:hypothetical protein ASE95_15910 [Sphingomonas sp. Leaf231]
MASAPPVTPTAPASPPSARPTRAAAKEFEAMFLGEMMKPMLEAAPRPDQFSGGSGEDMFRGVLAEELGKAMAERGGIGLTVLVERQLVALQEGSGR